MQIKNLSAAQVQPFGEILSAESELLPPCAERWQIRPGADVRELRADGPVVLDYVSGMPLLVIYEKDARSVYYLDRVLALRPGVRFSIAALGSGCEVDCARAAGTRTAARVPPGGGILRHGERTEAGAALHIFLSGVRQRFLFSRRTARGV